MKSILHFTIITVFICFIFSANLQSCTSNEKQNAHSDSLAIKESMGESPVLSPGASIGKMHLEDGFEIKLVAAEPLVVAPVAMAFDKKGRIWEVEMQDYMPDTLGTGENMPGGKVVILTDTNGDGIMDERKVFLDSLIMPRAICLIENGILVAEPPNLWYYDIINDAPENKTLVDSSYAKGGNAEHQPNGLLRAMDNWIYSAKSDKRYRKSGNKWLKERTHFRGQWGISQDDAGRLFYNTNSENLIGDYFSPGLGAENENQRSVAGYRKNIVPDNRVYPARPTPGVNRGYVENILDDSLRLINFTAACGPVIYRGGLFSKEYQGNAFVAEPSANLIKRNILNERGYIINGEEAYKNREFLASEDERFRPVNLYNGPDGALYIVDMYRGIIQHKTYLTPYLKNEIKERKLTRPLNCGRIYKIVPENSKTENITFPDEPMDLVPLLENKNGWVRSKAQQLLIDAKDKKVVPALSQFLHKTGEPLAVIHAMWTLEGLGALQPGEIIPLLQQNSRLVRMQALSVLPSILTKENYNLFIPLFQKMINENDTLAAPYIAFLVHYIQPFNKSLAHKLLVALTENYAGNIYVADAIISNLKNDESSYLKESLSINPDTSLAINERIKKVIDDIAKAKLNSDAKKLAKEFPKGAAMFQSVCQTCHGADGNGIAGLAPPLNNSNWVQGDKNKLLPIVLFGLTGPVKVDNKIYGPPEINGDMPGIGGNKEYSDEDIAQVLNYIRSSWNNKAEKISEIEISNARKKYKDRQKSFTMDELNQLK